MGASEDRGREREQQRWEEERSSRVSLHSLVFLVGLPLTRVTLQKKKMGLWDRLTEDKVSPEGSRKTNKRRGEAAGAVEGVL